MLDLSKIIAHRGASAYAPENTLVALRKAAELGCSWVECDLQISRDNGLYIFHDTYLKRITGQSGRFNQGSSKLIDACDAGAWFSDQYQGQHIPTCKQWLLEVGRLNLSVNIELKVPINKGEIAIRQLIAVIAELPADAMPQQILISASRYKLLQLLRRKLPNIARGMVIHRWSQSCLKKLQACDCYSANVNHAILTSARIEALKQHHFKILAYTVNSRAKAEDLFKQGVDAVFSDYPDLLSLR